MDCRMEGLPKEQSKPPHRGWFLRRLKFDPVDAREEYLFDEEAKERSRKELVEQLIPHIKANEAVTTSGDCNMTFTP